MLHNNIDCCIS